MGALPPSLGSYHGREFKHPISAASPHVFDVKDEDYVLPSAPLGATRMVRVIHVGAGFGGINLAYQVQRFMKNVELVCYEKNRCDLPAPRLTFAR